MSGRSLVERTCTTVQKYSITYKKIEVHSTTSAVANAQCTLIIWACAAKGEGGRKEEEGGVRREVKCKCVLCLVVFAPARTSVMGPRQLLVLVLQIYDPHRNESMQILEF